jgi:hypothetical protein
MQSPRQVILGPQLRSSRLCGLQRRQRSVRVVVARAVHRGNDFDTHKAAVTGDTVGDPYIALTPLARAERRRAVRESDSRPACEEKCPGKPGAVLLPFDCR